MIFKGAFPQARARTHTHTRALFFLSPSLTHTHTVRIMVSSVDASLKQLVVTIYLPYFCIAIGRSGYALLVPLFLRYEYHSTDVFIGFCQTLSAATGLLVSYKLGQSVACCGIKRSLQISTFVFILAFCSATFFHSDKLFLITSVVYGVAEPSQFLPHHTFLSAYVRNNLRGKTNSCSGGTFRIASIFGPMITAKFIELLGARLSFFCLCPSMFVSFLLYFFCYPDELDKERKRRKREEDEGHAIELSVVANEDPAHTATSHAQDDEEKEGNAVGERLIMEKRVAVMELLYDFRREYSSIGIFIFLLNCIREGRTLMIPLTGLSNGLTTFEIATCVSAGYGSGASMFPVSGYIMDNFGRRRNAMAAVVGMGCGFLLMSFVGGFAGLLLSSIVLGCSNGLSSGLQMTLGADTAPNDNRRSPYLGVYNMLGSIGKVLGPLGAGLLSFLFGAKLGALALSIVCILAALWIFKCVDETLVKPQKAKQDTDAETDGQNNKKEERI